MDEKPWDAIRRAVEEGNLEEAARLLLRSSLVPGMQRQLRSLFPRLPVAYVEDAIADAVSETWQVRTSRHPDHLEAQSALRQFRVVNDAPH